MAEHDKESVELTKREQGFLEDIIRECAQKYVMNDDMRSEIEAMVNKFVTIFCGQDEYKHTLYDNMFKQEVYMMMHPANQRKLVEDGRW